MYLPLLASVELSRRKRTVFETGVRWASRATQEVVYDKHAELLEKARRQARRVPGFDFPDDSGLPDEREALARALDETERAGLRVEVCLRGSHHIRTALKLDRPTFDAVVTDDNAALLLTRFLSQLGVVDLGGPGALARALASSGHQGRRLLQFLGLAALQGDGSWGLHRRSRSPLSCTSEGAVRSEKVRALRPLVLKREGALGEVLLAPKA